MDFSIAAIMGHLQTHKLMVPVVKENNILRIPTGKDDVIGIIINCSVNYNIKGL